jgi:pilus assembly protein FimV
MAVVKQYTENQYDDDLTVGTDDYDDSYYTGSVDLFEFASDEESPISRLKSLILSIDWEITDEVLMQFNEELVDLRDIWAGEKINLVYVQALEKISKYIYQKKADSHPSAIKLLLTLYHNLEKIVSSDNLSEEEKREILLEDVKRFESLKRHIGERPKAVKEVKTVTPTPQKQTKNIVAENPLLRLKAIVLSIDWEITDQDLNDLRKEVVRLEKKFVDSRPRLILLQGIGTLCAYIKLKKSNAHADAFKILHLFYESLEKIVLSPKTLEEEKAILFPAVEQFNSFKLMLGSTIEADAIKRDEKEADEDKIPADSSSVTPAFADIPEEDVKGFQAEEEALALGVENSDDIILDHIDNFFTGSDFEASEEAIHTDQPGSTVGDLSETAIQGVDVEIDDEDEEEPALTESDGPAPALSFAVDDADETDPAPALQEEEHASSKQESSSFVEEDEEKSTLDFSKLDKDIVLQGVEVETEADDDSDEEALPMMGGELAPALAENDETSIYNAEIFESSIEENIEAEITGTLGGFFDEEIESHVTVGAQSEAEAANEEETTIASAEDAGPKPTVTVEDEDETIAFVSPQSEQDDLAEEGFVADGDSAAVPEDVAEIDEHLDSFFGFEEGVEELAEDKLLYSEPDEPSENSIKVEDEVVPPAVEDTEDEVVFELVEEDDIVFSTPSAEDKSGDEFSKEFILTPDIDSVAAVYQSLRTSVEALGPGFEDNIIGDVRAEIDRLYGELSDRPLEKTFLQLLSTLTRHIDKNRHDVNGDAYSLLKSVCNTLIELDDNTPHKNQEMLLTETGKVLEWQEGLLAQQMVKQ